MQLAALLVSLLFASESNDRLIGYVGQQAIHQSQLTGTTEWERGESLRKLFIRPAIKAYLEPHRSQWQLTEKEIQGLIQDYRNSKKCSPPPLLSFHPRYPGIGQPDPA